MKKNLRAWFDWRDDYRCARPEAVTCIGSEILFVATAKGGMRLNHTSLYELLRELYKAGKIEHKRQKRRNLFRLRTKLAGLGWQCTTAEGGMFLDDRIRRIGRKRAPVVAWLNCNGGVYSVNVVSDVFNLTQSIPASVTSLEKAVDWVYHNSVWKGAAKNAKT